MGFARATTAVAAVAVIAGGCGRRHRAVPVATTPDARTADATSAPRNEWPELAAMPMLTAPLRVISLPARLDVPQFDAYGPVVSGDVAVIASSRSGFVAVDWKRGTIAWSKPGGAHVAPPVVLPSGDLVLLGDCATAPDSDQPILGCVRVVSSAGADRSYATVLGDDAAAAAMRGPGEPRAWALDEAHVAWQRGERTVTIEVATGHSEISTVKPPPLLVRYRQAALEIDLYDGELSAHAHDTHDARAGRDSRQRTVWRAPGRFAAVLGEVPGLSYESPMLRVVRSSAARGLGASISSYFDVLDLDAMTAAGGQAAFPAPGILLLATASAARGAAVLAVRLDRSLRRDYLVAYAPSARISWAYPLPVQLRTDPVGLAVTADAVLVFHDGDAFTVLPAIDPTGDPTGAASPRPAGGAVEVPTPRDRLAPIE
jgi:hypothetical protein